MVGCGRVMSFRPFTEAGDLDNTDPVCEIEDTAELRVEGVVTGCIEID